MYIYMCMYTCMYICVYVYVYMKYLYTYSNIFTQICPLYVVYTKGRTEQTPTKKQVKAREQRAQMKTLGILRFGVSVSC